jgi:exodeoxyribonuclease V beta subunit
MARAVRGYLTGSIDLALRVTGEDGVPRFAVVDYKTNWVGWADAPLTTWHYRPEAVVGEMARGHYWLQALLYLVALHRYLRWRLPDYAPERNLAGVLYLFVRGMAGAETPVVDGAPAGVVAWQPPPGVIEELSALMDEGGGS